MKNYALVGRKGKAARDSVVVRTNQFSYVFVANFFSRRHVSMIAAACTLSSRILPALFMVSIVHDSEKARKVALELQTLLQVGKAVL